VNSVCLQSFPIGIKEELEGITVTNRLSTISLTTVSAAKRCPFSFQCPSCKWREALFSTVHLRNVGSKSMISLPVVVFLSPRHPSTYRRKCENHRAHHPAIEVLTVSA